MALSPGTKLGPYEILAPLGAGGMGEVYRARDTRLDRTVAIKVLASHLSATQELQRRLEREAKAISQLSHPHICTLHDVGREGEVDFLVMEYLEGETLAQRLEKAPLPLEQALRTASEIADALDKARASYEAAHRSLENRVRDDPEDPFARGQLGTAYAGLGRKTEAIREAKRGVELLPVSKDAYVGVLPVRTLAVVYAMVGEHDAALDQIEDLRSNPPQMSVWHFRLDPAWDPLRDHPRLKKLVGEDWQAEVTP